MCFISFEKSLSLLKLSLKDNSSLLQLGSYFYSFGHHFFHSFHIIVLTKLIAEIWEHDDLTTTKSNRSRSMSSKTGWKQTSSLSRLSKPLYLEVKLKVGMEIQQLLWPWPYPSSFPQCFLVFPVLQSVYVSVCVCLWAWHYLPHSPGHRLNLSYTPRLITLSSHSPAFHSFISH